MASTLVSIFDIISYVGGNSDLARFQMLRSLRVLRLAKLFRLLRGLRIFHRAEMRYAIDYGQLALVQAMGMVMLVCHWSACVWALQVQCNTRTRRCLLSWSILHRHTDPMPLTYVGGVRGSGRGDMA
jgi:hypothetical protein